MSKSLKRKIWDLFGPVHGPFVRRLRRRLSRNYFGHPELHLPHPYEAVQLDVERNLHGYLHVSPDAISNVVIVGAYEADEVRRLHRIYPHARFLCFEPNPATYERLSEHFRGEPYVTLAKLALSNAPGKARFYELDLPGNGSLLEPDVKEWARFAKGKELEPVAFDVEVSTLDIQAARLPAIDLLWMDVQGAESFVLEGGRETLKRTRAIFLEVALVESPYKGAELFSSITKRLEPEGFSCVGLGIDAWNGSGNAFFVRDLAKLVSRPAASQAAA